MTIDTQERLSPPQAADRRSERRKTVDSRIQATTDWILTLDAKVAEGQITQLERAELIARSVVSRELLLERASGQKEKVTQRALTAEEQARIETERASRDPKTGLFNSEQFALQYQALQESGQSFGLLLLDIDNFKAVNDTWDHAVGDRVLIQTGKNIVANVRQIRPTEEENDMVFRYGGEEITVLLPGVNEPSDLQTVAEKLREAVGGTPYVIGREGEDLRIPITVSIGGGIFRPGNNGEEFFQKVDKAMYGAKAQGRNRSNVLPG